MFLTLYARKGAPCGSRATIGRMGVTEIVLIVVLLLLIVAFALLFNPPSGWVK